MASWIWGTSQFDEEVDKATSELLPTDQEDIALNLEICDQIKSKQVQPKDAMRALKRRLNHKNPNVQLLALTLTDVCVKNGGNHFLIEISSREFMDNYVSIIKIVSLNNDVKNRMLRFVQNWALALEGKPEFSYMNTVYKTLVSEGYKFPPKDLAIANNAMTDTAIAPEWIDSDVCLRCRDPFTFTNRKHHCRNCGQVFDQKCSSKSLPLPHFGIMQEVRVCDPCHFKLLRKKEAAAKDAENAAKKVARQQIRHEEIDQDLARAIELSLKESQSRPTGYAPLRETPRTWVASEPPLVERNQGKDYNDEDEELRAAIEASLREAHAPQPSAPAEESSVSNGRVYDSPVASVPSHELAPLESDAIMTFNQTISDAQTYGLRDLRQTHELYSRANTYQPKLTRTLDDTERKEQLLSEMHDKLSEAVKLYDHLLTEQFAQASRRQHAPSQPSYAPYMPHQQQYQPQQQWNAQPNIPAQYTNQYAPTQSYAPTSPMPDQGWAQTSYGVESAPSSAPAQQAPPSQEPTFSPQQVTQPPMTIQPSQYQVPSQPSSSYVQNLPSVTLPPVTINSPYSQPMPSQSPVPVTPMHAQPVQQPQQPLQQQPQQQQPNLSRHNTVQHHQVKQNSLHRSNTTANPRQAQQPFYANQQQHPQQQYQQPQQQQQQQQPQYNVASPPTAQPTVLPVLPTAPTNAPTNYSLFGPATAMPTVPNVPPVATEPKEAMLISFD